MHNIAHTHSCMCTLQVCGFFQPVTQLPKPVWRYPMHYISYHSYTFSGFMHNEFEGTDVGDHRVHARARGCVCACV